ncbi:MAG: hypothetical protein ACR2QJ_07085 [Geminicoccaceae bacterium]
MRIPPIQESRRTSLSTQCDASNVEVTHWDVSLGKGKREGLTSLEASPKDQGRLICWRLPKVGIISGWSCLRLELSSSLREMKTLVRSQVDRMITDRAFGRASIVSREMVKFGQVAELCIAIL